MKHIDPIQLNPGTADHARTKALPDAFHECEQNAARGRRALGLSSEFGFKQLTWELLGLRFTWKIDLEIPGLSV